MQFSESTYNYCMKGRKKKMEQYFLECYIYNDCELNTDRYQFLIVQWIQIFFLELCLFTQIR